MASTNITTEEPRARHKHQRGQVVLKSGQWYVRVYQDLLAHDGVKRKRVQLHACELLTWKSAATPSGRPYSRLVVSGPRTKGSGCTSWPTPTASDMKGQAPKSLSSPTKKSTGWSLGLAETAALHFGPAQNGSLESTASSVRLNPAFSLWLMGFPEEWSSCGARATQSCRSRRRRS